MVDENAFSVEHSNVQSNEQNIYENEYEDMLEGDEIKGGRIYNQDYWDMGDPTYECEHCGAYFWYEERIEKRYKDKASKFKGSSYTAKGIIIWIRRDILYIEEEMMADLQRDQAIRISYSDDDPIDVVINKPTIKESKFLSWFEANKEFPEARDLTYAEFPLKFVWKQQSKRWDKRKTSAFSIGRIFFVPLGSESYLSDADLKNCCLEKIEIF
ncbi:hypothetical protein KY290_007728 [Solanum tuberosum]|uniref:Uncharacterized protein n=1 Tax=Solanum tuberosum TaxID=4113 RepID=A0ABQ7W6E0_SOLTU|nr:hypothetical protein KY290_007728 [Solanum tuberosum]